MKLFLGLFLYCFSMLFLVPATASDEEKAKAFFENSASQSAEDYVSARIEQSLSERFQNIEIDITDLDGDGNMLGGLADKMKKIDMQEFFSPAKSGAPA